MAIAHHLQVSSHDSIYSERPDDCLGYSRKLNVYFSIPQNGINAETGLLLLIAGFGGQATANVYKQMRNEFSDKYNLVTVQCDYFGYEFMQVGEKVYLPPPRKKDLDGIFQLNEIEQIFANNKFNVDLYLKLGCQYKILIYLKALLSSNETRNNFCDMGLLQAIDNIVAVLNVMNILYDNDCCFNSKKKIIYGHSHGCVFGTSV